MSAGSQTLGKYEILAELGRGAFATVYRARDTTLEREVALKVLHPALLTDPAFIERFQREARALANLRHPHIVTVYEVAEVEGRVFIAMELARGPNLGQAIAQRGRIPWDEALVLLKPVCDALDYAHARGVVHRDLKPANILLDAERGPLLSDFGFARLMGDSSVSLSLSGGILGTPAYIAPEVWELDAAQPPADVYALGCIVYEMLTGEMLFPGKTPIQVMRAHDRGPQFPAAWPEGAPEGLAMVLGKALAREPQERCASALELLNAMEMLCKRETEAMAAKRRELAQRLEQERASLNKRMEQLNQAATLLERGQLEQTERLLAEFTEPRIKPPPEHKRVASAPTTDKRPAFLDCPKCGASNASWVLYCAICGARLKK